MEPWIPTPHKAPKLKCPNCGPMQSFQMPKQDSPDELDTSCAQCGHMYEDEALCLVEETDPIDDLRADVARYGFRVDFEESERMGGPLVRYQVELRNEGAERDLYRSVKWSRALDYDPARAFVAKQRLAIVMKRIVYRLCQMREAGFSWDEIVNENDRFKFDDNDKLLTEREAVSGRG